MSGMRSWSLVVQTLLLLGGLGVLFLCGPCSWLPTPQVITVAPPSPQPTDTPPAGPALTDTPLAEAPTDVPTVTPTPRGPDAKFVADVTVPDGTEVRPGESFVKVWRIRSTGSVPWPDGTRLVFVEGDRMGAPDGVPVPRTAVGSTADINVPMQAPTIPGTYRGVWRMEGPDGVRFGDRVFVQIVVVAPTLPPSVSFVADRYVIKNGQCVTLSWLVENVQGVYYQDEPVTGSGARVECPTTTTVYELRVQLKSGEWQSSTITITVEPAY
jgi:hypothetical protein